MNQSLAQPLRQSSVAMQHILSEPVDGPCPVARDQAIQVSDGSLKREYAREARAYWKEDSRQEVAVHTYAVAITRGTALCRGSLVRRYARASKHLSGNEKA